MIYIERLLSNQQSGVALAVKDFAETHGIFYGLDSQDSTLATNVEASHATLLISPRDQRNASQVALIKKLCAENNKELFRTEGRRHSEVIEWLDSLEACSNTLTLNVVGPTEAESPKGYALTWAMLQRILIAPAVLA